MRFEFGLQLELDMSKQARYLSVSLRNMQIAKKKSTKYLNPKTQKNILNEIFAETS